MTKARPLFDLNVAPLSGRVHHADPWRPGRVAEPFDRSAQLCLLRCIGATRLWVSGSASAPAQNNVISNRARRAASASLRRSRQLRVALADLYDPAVWPAKRPNPRVDLGTADTPQCIMRLSGRGGGAARGGHRADARGARDPRGPPLLRTIRSADRPVPAARGCSGWASRCLTAIALS